MFVIEVFWLSEIEDDARSRENVRMPEVLSGKCDLRSGEGLVLCCECREGCCEW